MSFAAALVRASGRLDAQSAEKNQKSACDLRGLPARCSCNAAFKPMFLHFRQSNRLARKVPANSYARQKIRLKTQPAHVRNPADKQRLGLAGGLNLKAKHRFPGLL